MKRFLFLAVLVILSFTSNIVNGQYIKTIAGNGIAGTDSSNGRTAFLTHIKPAAIAFDAGGNMYIADAANNVIRKVSACNKISTIAGIGTAGFSGDFGPATQAQLNNPTGIAIDATGAIYVADQGNNRIRKISNFLGVYVITTYAGGGTTLGDGGQASSASLNAPTGITTDASGNLYIADKVNNRIREVIQSTGIINTIAGTGTLGLSGDGSSAISAQLSNPSAVSVDGAGNVYVADAGNNRIRKISSTIITTVAGSSSGFSGDLGAATLAKLNNPTGVYVDASDNIYIADQGNNRIRYVNNTTGNISTLTGGVLASYSGDGGLANTATLNAPIAVNFHSGIVYIADKGNNRVRTIFSNNAPTFTNGESGSISMCENFVAYNLDTILEVSDLDQGQILTDSILSAPNYGTLVGTFKDTATGCTFIPNGLKYIPNPNYFGSDTFKIKISDGINSDSITVSVNVIPLPNAGTIVGASNVCLGSSTTLSNAVTSGVWSVTNSNASVSSTGLVNGLITGVDTVLFTVSTSTLSCTSISKKPIFINTSVLSPIVGSNTICTGIPTTYTDTMVSGTWALSNNKATVNSTTGVVTGLNAGIDTITYSLVACGATLSQTMSITINPTPSAGSITASSHVVCHSGAGSTLVLNNTVTGGIWAIMNTALATISSTTGTSTTISGIAKGIDTITFTKNLEGCTSKDTFQFTVGAYAGKLIGNDTVCLSSTLTLLDTTAQSLITWTYSSPGNAFNLSSTNTKAIMFGVSPGSETISASVTNSCGTDIVSKTIVISDTPTSRHIITGPNSICNGLTLTLSETGGVGAGYWQSSNSAIAVVSAGTSGAAYVFTNASGSVILTYTSTINFCNNAYDTITVIGAPIANPITGSNAVCIGQSITLFDTTLGFSASWLGNGNATISTTGSTTGHSSIIVTGVTSGLDTISYTYSNSCGLNTTVTKIITIYPAPNAGVISGSDSVCDNSSSVYTSSISGGTWSVANTTNATISHSGVLTGLISSGGTDNVIYTVTSSSGCGSASTARPVYIKPLPTVDIISGPTFVCTGAHITLYDDTIGGIWSLKNLNASILSVSSDTVVIKGITSGLDTIYYKKTNLCGTTTITFGLNVFKSPVTDTIRSISGHKYMCVGDTTTLVDTASGIWLSSNNTIATISSIGVVTGVSAGNVTLMYLYYGYLGCSADTVKFNMTVKPLANAGTILGSSVVCQNSKDSLIDTTNNNYIGTIKVWRNLHPTIASIVTSGNYPFSFSRGVYAVAKGLSAGIDTINFKITNSCSSDSTRIIITVNPLPVPDTIVGLRHVCNLNPVFGINLYDTLIAKHAKGLYTSWSFSNPKAFNYYQNNDTLVVAGANLGTGQDIVTVTSINSCGSTSDTFALNVNPWPTHGTAFVQNNIICQNTKDTIRLTSEVGSTHWYSSNTSIATVLPNGITHAPFIGNGEVHPVNVLTQDTVIITQVTANSCGSDTQRFSLVVVPNPFVGHSILSRPAVCSQDSIIVKNPVHGGVWNLTNLIGISFTSLDSLDSSFSKCTLHTFSYGVNNVLYTYSNACGSKTDTAAFTVYPLPFASAISGNQISCIGTKDTFNLIHNSLDVYNNTYEYTNGGIWGLLHSHATINSSGIVIGNSIGKDSVFYHVISPYGCKAPIGGDTSYLPIKVLHAPVKSIITGPSYLCVGNSAIYIDTLVDTNSYSYWKLINANATGGNSSQRDTILGLTAGKDTLMYISYNGCGVDTSFKNIVIDPIPNNRIITSGLGYNVCLNTLYQNFALDSSETLNSRFIWSAKNAQIFSTGSNKQYCLVNFNLDTGISIISILDTTKGTGCSAITRIQFHVDSTIAPNPPFVNYGSSTFNCLDNTAKSYQWGYDVKLTDQSFNIPYAVDQNYYLPSPDFVHNLYWVMVNYGTCSQKSYYILPQGVEEVANNLSINCYPNPVIDNLIIDINDNQGNGNYSAKIFEISGKEILSFPYISNKQELNLTKLSTGIYFVSIYKNGIKIDIKKIVKN